MPKMKGHSGAKKRFRVTKNGNVKFAHSNKEKTIFLLRNRANVRWVLDRGNIFLPTSRIRP